MIKISSHIVYNDTAENMTKYNSLPRGLSYVIHTHVDTDHTGNLVTRKSRARCVVLLNNASIYWLSKHQNGVETSSFGSEFMAMKHCCEYFVD